MMLFAMDLSDFKEYITKVLVMRFSVDSRMLVHALSTLNLVTVLTGVFSIARKF